MEAVSTTTTSLWLVLLAYHWLLLYLTDGGNILWDPVYQGQTRLRAKNWLDQSQDAFIGIWREVLMSLRVVKGLMQMKREPWGQKLPKPGASVLEFLFLWATE